MGNTDQMAATSPAELLRELDAAVAPMGWDQPLVLAVVHRTGNGFALIPVELPAPLNDIPPWQALPAFADAARSNPHLRAELAPLFTGDYVGWLLIFEARGMSTGPDDTPERRARVELARRTRTNYLQPDREECRMFVLAYGDGEVEQLSRVRGTDGQPDRVVAMDDAGGGFPRALRRLADLGGRIQSVRRRTGQEGPRDA